MPIVVPNFNTTALITGSTLISDADNQLNILMDDVTNYVENTYDAIATSIEGTVATDAASALASANLAEKWASEVEDTPVIAGKYSAFHWSQKAFNTVFASSQHILRVDNPHSVTKSQVGLGNADNTADIDKNVLSATKLTTPRNIALTGDITGNVNFDGSSDVSITATVTPNSVALGSDTTGDYVAGNTAGTGITVSGTVGEAWSPTIAITDIGTAGTYRSVTTNAQGQVISGTNPTTIADYGITDAYTKTQIDAIAQGLNAKASVLVASTSALVFNTATPIIDDVTLTASDRVLVKDQTNQAQNGIYTNITTTSWTRTSDTDSTLELKSAYVFVDSGTVNVDTAWVQTNDIVTIDTTPVTWAKFAGAGAYSPIGHLHSASDITSGILPVVRGGTGVNTSTGTGSVVLNTSPTFTGTPEAPTASVGTNTTQLATTAYVQTAVNTINSLRADRYLSLQNIALMLYNISGDLIKIQYNNATDVDYEVLGYTSGNLVSIEHYIGSVLKGTTTLSYTSGNLVSAIFA